MTDVSRRSLSALVACAVLLPGVAQSQTRPDTRAMTCAEASALVARAGAIVMSTGPVTYARFVRDGGFCPLPETTQPSWEITRDDPKCFVGYTCRDKFNEGQGRD
ncbi:hypothetical protein MKK58_01030 [Methylobacterium sp. J-078]|uniref:hypothetical protein n=1 Tax=Methylobacterium sp. J-078 TaxID=2836657 RepID=UPI001FBA3525|nr:hypothetical protein [Methylobacterium sp. J-078]MCJ2043138.1 hypothetical protein [Methylobacterium sp. J-078]